MKKLFEIPIYACSPSVFSIRVRKHKETLSSEHLQSYRKIDDVPSKYYVDRESFDNIDSIVDYSKLVLKG